MLDGNYVNQYNDVFGHFWGGQSLNIGREIVEGVDFTTAARHQSRILDMLNVASPMQLLKKLQMA